MQDTAPLIALHSPEAVLLWHDGRPVPAGVFLAQTRALVAELPAGGVALNLCEGRHAFMLAFAAALLRGHTSLLPPNRSVQAIREIAADNPGTYVLRDQGESPPGIPALDVRISGAAPDRGLADAVIPRSRVAVQVYTSGSTGRARPNVKTWGSLCCSTGLAATRFLAELQQPANIVATVPPQHMYGLETSILLPLQAGAAVHSGRPFFPGDVRAALEEIAAPRVLVTTPIHLRACVRAGLRLPPIAFIISATAPLAPELAREAEALFDAPVREIYGCTEVGMMASRRTVADAAWRLYDGMSMDIRDGRAWVEGPQLETAVELQDVIEKTGDAQFVLHGRDSDMLNIAGKRASLADLNCRLQEVEGVVDGVIFLPEQDGAPAARVAALVVAPTLTRDALLVALGERMDPVFLPRPLLLVDALPRSETSKLPRAVLEDMLRRELGRS
jgi:acyl-coenzyme A synthetase/AMP-(fatty) acid ligase